MQEIPTNNFNLLISNLEKKYKFKKGFLLKEFSMFPDFINRYNEIDKNKLNSAQKKNILNDIIEKAKSLVNVIDGKKQGILIRKEIQDCATKFNREAFTLCDSLINKLEYLQYAISRSEFRYKFGELYSSVMLSKIQPMREVLHNTSYQIKLELHRTYLSKRIKRNKDFIKALVNDLYCLITSCKILIGFLPKDGRPYDIVTNTFAIKLMSIYELGTEDSIAISVENYNNQRYGGRYANFIYGLFPLIQGFLPKGKTADSILSASYDLKSHYKKLAKSA